MNSLRKRELKKNIAIILPLVITTFLWGYAKYDQNESIEFINILEYTAELFGLWGLVLLSTNYILSTKSFIIEAFYGGLDKIYKIHSQIGKISFVLILLHPILLAINSISEVEIVQSLFIPFVGESSLAKVAGISALYLYIVLILISIFRFMPYNFWLWTHKLIGIPFLLSGFHALNAESDIKYSELLRNWILIWIFLGVIAYIYKTFLYFKLGPYHEYEIIKTHKSGDINELYMKPVHKKMNFEPGEFVFLSYLDNDFISSEHHPFSISSSPNYDELRISYKILGDYTHRLSDFAKTGDRVNLYGPYGEFTSYVFNPYKKQIWIAGGIGVTPFISMLDYEKQNNDKKDIHFFYCTATKDQCIYLPEITNMVDESDDKIQIHTHASKKKGRLTADQIDDYIGHDELDSHLILLCGPVPMMKDLKDQLIEKGVPSSMIIFEEFGFV